MSTATVGYGSQLLYSTTEEGSYSAIAQTVDLAGPEPEIGEVNITNNDSANATKEYLPGMIEPGEMEFEVIYKKDACNTLYTMFSGRTVYWFKLAYPDGSYWIFPGFLNSFGTEAPTEDEAIRNTIGIKLTALPTFTPSIS
jgi:hypothetical protein